MRTAPSIHDKHPVAQASGLWSLVFQKGGPMGPPFFYAHFLGASLGSAHPRIKDRSLIREE